MFLITLLTAIPLSVWRGYVLSKLWVWFVVPIGVPNLNIPQAMGISLLVSMLTYDANVTRKTDKLEQPEKIITTTIGAVILPLFALGFGAVWHAFM